MSSETYNDLDYLKHPQFIGFGQQIFTDSVRLPTLGAIFELTPIIEEDLFYMRQVVNITEGDPANTLRQLRRTQMMGMICLLDSQPDGIKKFYRRLPSPRWNIIDAAIKAARLELDI